MPPPRRPSGGAAAVPRPVLPPGVPGESAPPAIGPLLALPDRAEVGRRIAHLEGLVFTEFTAVALATAVIVWLASRRLRTVAGRETLLVAVSLALLAWLGSLPVALAWVAWAGALWIAVERCPRAVGRPLAIALIGAMIVLPVVMIAPLGAQGGHVREFTAFATNFAVLRAWGWAWDRWHTASPPPSLRRYLVAMFFFPTFVNGPVEVPRQFEADWERRAGVPTGADLAQGLGRIALGVAKLVAVGIGLPPGWTAVLARGANAPQHVLWLWSALLYLWFFLSFSAWSDVAIGLGRVTGRRVQENFLAPWKALEPADFWHRWHVSLGIWLRDYVYIPLGGNRRHRARNVLAAFVVSAAWHLWGSLKLLGFGYFPPRGWGGLALWGLLNAGGVLAAAPIREVEEAAGGAGRTAGRVGTFLFASLCWLPFFLPGGVSLAACLAMLGRMLWPFGS